MDGQGHDRAGRRQSWVAWAVGLLLLAGVAVLIVVAVALAT